MAELEELHK